MKLMDEIAKIDEKYILEAEPKNEKKKHMHWQMWLVLAACMVAVLALSPVAKFLIKQFSSESYLSVTTVESEDRATDNTAFSEVRVAVPVETIQLQTSPLDPIETTTSEPSFVAPTEPIQPIPITPTEPTDSETVTPTESTYPRPGEDDPIEDSCTELFIVQSDGSVRHYTLTDDEGQTVLSVLSDNSWVYGSSYPEFSVTYIFVANDTEYYFGRFSGTENAGCTGFRCVYPDGSESYATTTNPEILEALDAIYLKYVG